MTTPNVGLSEMPSNSLQPSVPFNQSMQIVDALLRPGSIVQAMDIAADPVTTGSDIGKRWVVATGGSGDWTGKDGQIALCVAANAWLFFVPSEGWEVRNLDEDARLYVYDGAAWVPGISSSDTSYDNTISGLTADNVKAALDELASLVGLSGVAVTHVGSATVTGSAASVLSISGLDLSADESYYIEFQLENATGSTANISLYYNSDTTATHYYNQALAADGASATAGRANSGLINLLPANECMGGRMWISNDRDGKPRARGDSSRDAAASIILRSVSHIWNSATNITDLTLSSSVSNALAVGSKIRVFKIKE